MKNLFLNRFYAFVLLTIFSCANIVNAQKTPYQLGLTRDDAKYMGLKKRSKDFSLMRGILPSSYSLERYVPTIGFQGDFSTCVGWSTAYYLRTTMQAKKVGTKTHEEAFNLAFSPSYIYERIKRPNQVGCQSGTAISDALDIMKQKGVATLKCAPYACGEMYTNCDAEAANYKIEGYNTLFELGSSMSAEQKILAVKTALVETENPVAIGMFVPSSFFKATEVWKAAPGESFADAVGGHAMTIVAYDDEKGAFLLVNSWGTKWGVQGYTWASYRDLVEFTPYAYEVLNTIEPTPTPVNPVTPVKPVVQVTLKGSMDLVLNQGGSMSVEAATDRGLDVTTDKTTVSDTTKKGELYNYTVNKAYPSGTSFKAIINNNVASYVYIIGSDESNRVSKLFPYQDQTSSLVPAKNTATLPSQNSSFTMDNKEGTDYFLVLYSTKELDIEKIKQGLKNASGTFNQKVFTTLGTDLIDPDAVTYEKNKIAFEIKGTPKGSIVPLVVKINHVK